MSVVKGLVAGNAAYAIQTIVRLATTAFVARLITPEEMGIWTLGFAVIMMFNVLRDFGTATYIQTYKDLTSDHIKACNTIQMAIGCGFFLLFIVGAPFVANFYREPRVSEVLYVLALGLIVMPFSSTNFNLLIRDGRFETRTAIDFTGQMIIYLGGAICAYFGAAHLSAPIAVIVSQVAVVIICLKVRNRSYPMGFSTKEIKNVMGTSGTALGTSLLQLASDRSADFVLPKTQGFGPASIYEKGVNSLELVRVAVVDLFGSVLLSSLRLRSESKPSYFPAIATDIFYFSFVLSSIGAMILAFNAKAFIVTLFGNQWITSIETLQILAISTPFVCSTALLTKIMFLTQMHHVVLKTAIFTRLGVLATVIGLSHGSLKTLAIGVVIAEISFFMIYAKLNGKNINWATAAKALVIDIPACLVISVLVNSVLSKFFTMPPAVEFLANGCLIFISCVAFIFLARKASWSRVRNSLNLKS